MKITLFALMILLISNSCDAPQRTRNPYGVPLPASTSETEEVNNFSNNDSSQTQDPDGESIVPPTTPATGLEDCNLNFQFYGGSIGYFGMCKNSQQQNKFKVKMAISVYEQSQGTCFVPINIQPNGSSYKLGIAECVTHQANMEYDMTLTTERAEPINGVMVIKYLAVGPYMNCMNAKINFYNSATPNCIYDPSCVNAAENYAASICTQFVSTYSNYYKQVPMP